jgi:light-regulated signal transduction histidine kinase (bacteriophytochrome)
MKEKNNELKNSLESNKIFLNMVVHDMRNPTNQIEYILNQSINQLKDLKNHLNNLDFSIKNLDNDE